MTDAAISFLSAEEIEWLSNALAGARHVLGYQADETCFLAARGVGTYSIFAAADSDQAMRLQLDIDRCDLPSAPLIQVLPPGASPWTLTGVRDPDVALVPAKIAAYGLWDCRRNHRSAVRVIVYPDVDGSTPVGLQAADFEVGALKVFDVPAPSTSVSAPAHVQRRPRIRAHMATYPARSLFVQQALDSLCGQVDAIYLCLNEYSEPPSFLNSYPNVVPYVPPRDLKDVGKFVFTPDPDEIVFCTDDDLIYVQDYVETVLNEAGEGQLDQNIFGLHGVCYEMSDDGAIVRQQSSRHFENAYDTTMQVDQIGTGTAVVLGKNMPPFDFMQGSQSFTDVRFARYMFEQNLPLWSLRRRANLITSIAPENKDTIWENFTKKRPAYVADEIERFAMRASGVGTSRSY